MVNINRAGWIVRSRRFRAGWFCALASLVALLPSTGANAQVTPNIPSQYELSELVRLDQPDRAAQTHLERIQAYLANQKWDDAVKTLRLVMENHDYKVIRLSGRRHVTVQDYCHWQISCLPEEGLKLYRSHIDSLARQWYEKAVAGTNLHRDSLLLENIVDQLFCSSWGDDALLALGDLALEQGDFGRARACWEKISPLLKTDDWTQSQLLQKVPEGLPLWHALRGVDLDKHWEKIHPMLLTRAKKPSRLVYPDTDLILADVRARLVLVSILEGEIERARIELGLFSRLHPKARGRLGGQEVRYRDGLQALLAESTQWPAIEPSATWSTFAGSVTRNKIHPNTVDVGSMVKGFPISLGKPIKSNIKVLRNLNFPPRRIGEDHNRLLSYHPIIVGENVFLCDLNRIKVFNVRTGRPAWNPEKAEIYKVKEFNQESSGIQPILGVPRFTMTAYNNKLYARMGSSITIRHTQQGIPTYSSYLVCLDLESQGKRLWQIPKEGQHLAEFKKDRWAFEGSPVTDGTHVYVGMRRSYSLLPQAHVACFEAATGKLLWRRLICASQTPSRGQSDECSHNLLTLHRGTLYYNTNQGAVASLRARDGKINWLHLYSRVIRGDISQPAAHLYRDLNPCVYYRGMVFVAPSDSKSIFALDTSNGHQLWKAEKFNNQTHPIHLLGVGKNHLIASGTNLWWINIYSGNVTGVWGENYRSAESGYGRGLLAGDKILWPTREKILVFRQEAPPSKNHLPPKVILLHGRGGHAQEKLTGGNLLIAGKQLLIATPQRLLALGEQARSQEKPSKSISKYSGPRAPTRSVGRPIVGLSSQLRQTQKPAKEPQPNSRE